MERISYGSINENDRLKWNSRSILEGNGQIGDLRQEIPQFAEAPFSVEDRGENKYLRTHSKGTSQGRSRIPFPKQQPRGVADSRCHRLETVQASSTSSYSNVIRNGR